MKMKILVVLLVFILISLTLWRVPKCGDPGVLRSVISLYSGQRIVREKKTINNIKTINSNWAKKNCSCTAEISIGTSKEVHSVKYSIQQSQSLDGGRSVFLDN